MDKVLCGTCGSVEGDMFRCFKCECEICTLCLEVVNGGPHCSDCARGVCHAQRTEEDDQVSQAE